MLNKFIRFIVVMVLGCVLILTSLSILYVPQMNVLAQASTLQMCLNNCYFDFGSNAVQTSGSIIRVMKTGNPAQNGNSWANATMLTNALVIANSGDEIWVAGGVYTPGTTISHTFNLPSGVAVYGGFAATETQVIQRDWHTNPTILSGDIDGNDIDPNGDGIVITATQIVGNNSDHVVTADGTINMPINKSTILDGFIITAGQAKGEPSTRNGGGFYCKGSGSGHECSPTLRNITFSGNTAGFGGAMYNEGSNQGTSSPDLINVAFFGNLALYGGGAIYNNGYYLGNSSPTVRNAIFSGNAAGFGGAMYNHGEYGGLSSPRIINATFSGNSASSGGGAISSNGIYPGTSGISTIHLTNVILWGNTARKLGHQIHSHRVLLILDHTLIQSGTNDITHYDSTFAFGPGIITDNPLFIDPDGADNILGTLDDDLQLSIFSPATDAGINNVMNLSTDLNGSPRFSNDMGVPDRGNGVAPIVDLGAYERQSNSPNCPSSDPIYVDKDALSGNSTGTDWENAFTSLQTGLSVARICSSLKEIWVAKGVYTPGVLHRDSFNLIPGIAIYGGFVATETVQIERDWEINSTILSGDIDGDDADLDNDGILTTTAQIVGTNSNHIIYGDGVNGVPLTETAVLDGFIVTAGQANFSSYIGGGFYCNGGGNNSECSPQIRNIIFTGNWASTKGGAMYNKGSDQGNSSPSLNKVTFIGNSAGTGGGAIYNDGVRGSSNPSLNNVTFISNSALFDGGAMFNSGLGGVSTPIFNNLIFYSNSVVGHGGAMYNEGSSPDLTNGIFVENSASWGGAIANEGTGGTSSPNLSNIVFVGNSAATGGAMYNRSSNWNTSSPIINNAIFSGNTAIYIGGAMSNNSIHGTTSPILNNVTFYGNSATKGGAMVNQAMSNYTVVSPKLTNVILWDNIASELGHQMFNQSATPVLSYTLIQSGINYIVNQDVIFNPPSIVTYGPNILTSDPLFIDPDGTDNITGTLDDNLRLAAYSPAIDAGLNSAINLANDLDNNPRFYDDTSISDTGSGIAPIIDLGAYERQSNSPTPEINISGNNQPIISGQTASDIDNHTDFENALVNGNSVVRTFTISNSGTAALNLSGTPTVNLIAGTHFTVSVQPTQSIDVGGSSLFRISFNPTTSGSFTDTVIIVNNDLDENPYTFVVSGTGLAEVIGLMAYNDSPTALGQPTIFSATVSAGDNVSYNWNFGDGEIDSGVVVTHTYPTIGTYPAVVTASNSLSVLTTSMDIIITDVPITSLAVTSNSPTPLGELSILTATISTGSNVSYVWDFGDGHISYGAVITHTYLSTGVHTVNVVASNAVSEFTATTKITITEPYFYIYLPVILRVQ